GAPCGGLRRFAFMDAPGFDAQRFDRLRASMAVDPVPTLLLGRDRDAGAVESALANAEMATLPGDAGITLDFACAALSKTKSELAQRSFGEAPFIVANPPYGKRIGDNPKLVGLYRGLGELAEGLAGSRLTVISAREDLLRAVGAGLAALAST